MYLLKSKFLLKDPDTFIGNGAVVIDDAGKIKFAGKYGDIKGCEKYQSIDLGNCAIVPGFVNAHTHLELTHLYKCIKSNGNFTNWIRQLVDKKKLWSDKDYTLSVHDGINSSITSGTTTIVDITRSGSALKELSTSKIRKMLFFEMINFNPETAEESINDFKTIFAGIKEDDLLSLGIFPHAPYTVSDKLYESCKSVSKEFSIAIATHIAETKDEVEFLLRGTGSFVSLLDDFKMLHNWTHPRLSPANYLKTIGFLENGCILIHGNYLSEDEMDIIAKAKSDVVYCPRSHSYFGHDDYPLFSLRNREINVALGTDSLASNDTLSILDEMKFIRKQYRGLTSRDIFYMGTIGGAVALNMNDCIGRLFPGYYADIAVIEFENSNISNIYDGIFSQNSQCVLTIVSGEICYDKNKLARFSQ